MKCTLAAITGFFFLFLGGKGREKEIRGKRRIELEFSFDNQASDPGSLAVKLNSVRQSGWME